MGTSSNTPATKQKITPFLWFDDKAEEAANLYVSIFKDSKILSITRCGEAGPGPKGRSGGCCAMRNHRI